MNFQIRLDYPIAIWQNVNSQFFPYRLDEFPNQVGLPSCDLTKCQFPIFPRPFGWISKPCLITQFRFDKILNLNFSLTVWVNFQIGSDYPIAIWQSIKSQFFPDRVDNFPNRVWSPNCDLIKCQIPIFSRQFGWISKPSLIIQLRFDKFQIRIFSQPLGWIFKLGLITQLRFDKCQIPIYPQPFGWISGPGLITQLWSNKYQIPIFPQPFGWISEPSLITQLWSVKCQILIFP